MICVIIFMTALLSAPFDAIDEVKKQMMIAATAINPVMFRAVSLAAKTKAAAPVATNPLIIDRLLSVWETSVAVELVKAAISPSIRGGFV